MPVQNLTGPTPTNLPSNQRLLTDANYTASVALPATANSTVYTAPLFLGDIISNAPYPATETINVLLSESGSATGASQTCTMFLQHTTANADGSVNSGGWVNIPTLAVTNVVQTSSSTPEVSAVYKLPPNTLGYIRAGFTNPTGSTNLSDGTLTLQLLF
jgi:hypothetical protein